MNHGIEIENISIFERFLQMPKNWFLSITVLFGILLGPLGTVITSLILYNDIYAAIENTVVLYFTKGMDLSRNILGIVFLQLILFYLLYMIKYMYMKLTSNKDSLIKLLHGGEPEFKLIFSNITKPLPPLVIALVFMVVYGYQAIPETNFQAFTINLSGIVFLLLSYSFWFIVFTIFFWVYASSIRGLYVMGRRDLDLKTYVEDKMLGVRPISSLSLSFAFTYFSGVGLLTLLPILLSEEVPSLSFYFMVGLMTLLGLIIFFLPLYSFHLQMRTYKELEKSRVRRRLLDGPDVDLTDEGVSLSEVKKSIDRFSNIVQSEIIYNEIDKIPVWPIDLSIISRLTAMMVSIISIILANFIMKRIIRL